MSKIVQFHSQQQMEESATLWLIRLDGGGLTEADHQAFGAWLDEHPEHLHELLRQARLWDNMSVMAQLAELFPLQRRRTAQRSWLVGGGFAIACVVMLVMGLLLRSLLIPEYPVREYATAVGEQLQVELPDGSRVVLNTDSRMAVRFDDSGRYVSLLRGEALFDVAPIPDIPFLVRAGAGVVQAVGTAFLVRTRFRDVEVIVTEGRVRVASSESDAAADLARGETVSYDENSLTPVQTLSEEAVARRLAWQEGMLAFEDDTLARVIEEMSRYSSKRIVLTDPALAEIPIAGYFRAGEVEPLLALLEANFDVKVERDSAQDTVYIRPQAHKKSI